MVPFKTVNIQVSSNAEVGSLSSTGSLTVVGNITGIGNHIFEVASTQAPVTIIQESYLNGLELNGNILEVIGGYNFSPSPTFVVTRVHSIREGRNTSANGSYSHAEGFASSASGNASHAEGDNTTASNTSSHSEGSATIASANASHAEGIRTHASGNASHSEGYYTRAIGIYSHAEGEQNYAFGDRSHAEGVETATTEKVSFATYSANPSAAIYTFSSSNSSKFSYVGVGTVLPTFGISTPYNNIYSFDSVVIARNSLTGAISASLPPGIGGYNLGSGYILRTNTNSIASHAEGGYTQAIGGYSHAEGLLTIASGSISHAEGQQTLASGTHAHAEGAYTTASGSGGSHSEGGSTIASGFGSHAEGGSTQAIGGYSHAEGFGTIANGVNSHTEGYQTTANSDSCHAEGKGTTASSDASHAEGGYTQAIGGYSHSEGYVTIASGQYAHSQNWFTTASGPASNSEGYGTQAIGGYSHASGMRSIAQHDNSWIWRGLTAPSLLANTVSTTRSGQFMVSAEGGVFIPGNVGIGTDNNSNKLTVSGTISSTNITVSNLGSFDTLQARIKNFNIPHPIYPNKRLQYSSLESPYIGVQLTGEAELLNGACIVKLPDYICELIHKYGVNIQLTNYKHSKTLYVDSIDIGKNQFIVKCDSIFAKIGKYKFFWTLNGIRKDVPELEVEI